MPLEAVLPRPARRGRDLHRPADQRRVDVHLGRALLQHDQLVEREDLRQLGRRLERAGDDGQLLVVRRVVDEHLQHEPVDLRLRQRVRALRLDRVLGREDEERAGHREGAAADRHLALLHHLEQRRLHLRGRAVDLVGEQEVAEDRPELDLELGAVGPVDARADEVGRHQVGGELHAVERAAEHRRRGLDRQRLRQAGHAFDQQVAARQQADEHALEHRLLPGDHAPDLEQRLLELPRDLIPLEGSWICHPASFSR